MTERCPVCLLPAERVPDRDYGRKKQVLCSRCGPFEISRTALATLDNRVNQDPRVRARRSHAIRLITSEDNRLFVSSENLDELAQQPLPDIPQQLEYLKLWLAAQLEDDRLGRIPCPSPESLAGIIGAVDGERVGRLIDYAVEQGIVEHDALMNVLGLSPEGWRTIEPSKPKHEPETQASPTEIGFAIGPGAAASAAAARLARARRG
ncbi:MAG: hypothetical protein ACT4P2_15185 [Pseudomonadota bacterium]